MTKKQVRNPRIFVDTPADLKADYAALCKAFGTTMSEDLKSHMRAVVRHFPDRRIGLCVPGEDEQKEPA